ncbi:MAG: hypothetical protein OEZ39_04205 [Gammaproteobacteria bacterium]|nr:hypothetical protein [Gammaproteobacteria bacterium]MDH5651061.1 hypothetical protein [Gammaproteobacteria bacterium]
MHTLILLIVFSVFLLWFGINYRRVNGKIAAGAIILGLISAGLVLIGVWGY